MIILWKLSHYRVKKNIDGNNMTSGNHFGFKLKNWCRYSPEAIKDRTNLYYSTVSSIVINLLFSNHITNAEECKTIWNIHRSNKTTKNRQRRPKSYSQAASKKYKSNSEYPLKIDECRSRSEITGQICH